MMLLRVLFHNEYYACVVFDGSSNHHNAQLERFPFLQERLKHVQPLYFRSYSDKPLNYIFIPKSEYKRLEVLKFSDIDKLCKN